MANDIPTDSSALVAQWFRDVRGVSPETTARVSARVEGHLTAGTCKNMMAMAPPDFLVDYELRACVGLALREEWDTLSGEERLLICRHPRTRRLGDQIRLPNYAVGTVMAQELTERLGVLVTVRQPDGTLLTWEFYE